MAPVRRLDLDEDVIDVVEHARGGIRRTVVGDVEADAIGQRRDSRSDLVDETADAFGLVVGGHHDGEMRDGHGVLRTAAFGEGARSK